MGKHEINFNRVGFFLILKEPLINVLTIFFANESLNLNNSAKRTNSKKNVSVIFFLIPLLRISNQLSETGRVFIKRNKIILE